MRLQAFSGRGTVVKSQTEARAMRTEVKARAGAIGAAWPWGGEPCCMGEGLEASFWWMHPMGIGWGADKRGLRRSRP